MAADPRARAKRIQRALFGLLLGLFALFLWLAQNKVHASERTAPMSPGPEMPLSGRWFPTPAPMDDATKEQLRSIGYAQGYETVPGASGVVRRDAARTCPGLNLVFSGHGPEVLLMDASGKPLHTWTHRYDEVWSAPIIPEDRNLTFGETLAAQPDIDPDLTAKLPKYFLDSINLGHTYFRRGHLYPNGDLLTFYLYLGVIKLDKDSKVLWSRQMMAHHDLDVAADGRIFIIGAEPRAVPGLGDNGFLLDDYIAVLTPDGALERKISVLDAFLHSPYAAMVNAVPQEIDLLHTNTVTILDGRLAARIPAFQAGNLLISCRNISTIAVLDPETGAIVWAMTGPWKWQHEPSVLDNGRLLLLDNQGNDGFSRVLEFDPVTLEIDPVTLEITWNYAGTPPESFSTLELGSVARLPNGNTLVTESYKGHAFELTPAKEIVWEFFNPQRAGEHNELIAAVYEVVRLPLDFDQDWLLHAQRNPELEQ